MNYLAKVILLLMALTALMTLADARHSRAGSDWNSEDHDHYKDCLGKGNSEEECELSAILNKAG